MCVCVCGFALQKHRIGDKTTHVRLHHLTALCSDARDEAENVHLPLRGHHVQHGVDHDEGARAAHAGATVHHDGPGVLGVAVLHLLQELEHADGGEGHAEVGPAGEVELGDEPLGLLA